MAIKWGSWVGPTGEQFRMGIDISSSGTKISVKYYVESKGRVIGDNAVLTRSGAISGTKAFQFNAGTNGATLLVDSQSMTGVRGKKYEFGAKANKFYIGDGYVASVSDDYTIPVLVPATPTKPTLVSRIQTGLTVKTTITDGNGAKLLAYQWQLSITEGFPDENFTRTFEIDAETLSAYKYPVYVFSNLEPNVEYFVRVRAKNSSGYSAWSKTLTVSTLPALPLPQTSVTAIYMNDSRIYVSWGREISDERPYDSQVVQRWDSNSNAWVAMSVLTDRPNMWDERSSWAGPRFRYRVKAKNKAGSSEWAYSNFVDTTPYLPDSITATRVGSNIVVDWTRAKRTVMPAVEVWHQGGSGAWELLATVTSGEAGSYTHVAPSGTVTHQYRVRSKSESPILWSDYRTSTVVQVSAIPNVPTIYSLSSAVDREAASGVALAWKHNPADSSTQTKFQIRGRALGASAWIEHTAITWEKGSADLLTTLTRLGLTDLTNGQTFEWQVRTWGVFATSSAYSATSTVVFSATPLATISGEVDTAVTPKLNLQWAYFQEQASAQGQWQAEILDDSGSAFESRNGSGTQTSVQFSRVLAENRTWTARVRVRSGAGIWSQWDEWTFTTDYAEPMIPSVSGQWQRDTGSIEVTVENPAGASDSYEVTNVFTNPGFTGLAGNAIKNELRRNAYIRPKMTSLDGLSYVGGGSIDVAPGGAIEVTGSSSGSGVALGGNIAVQDYATTLTAAIDVTGVLYGPAVWKLSASGVGITAVESSRVINDGETVRLAVTFEVTKSATAIVLNLTIQDNPFGGAVVRISKPVVEGGKVAGPYFDGSTTTDDPDIQCNWASGVVNNAISYMRGWVPRLVQDTSWPVLQNSVRSSTWSYSGEHSLRVLPGGTAYVHVGPLNGLYTLTAWCRVTEPADVDDSQYRAIIVKSGSGYIKAIAQAPNEAGVYALRVVAEDYPQYVFLTGQAGSDVYWDCLTMIEGEDLNTLPFEGGTRGYTTETGYAVTHSWDAVENEDTSTALFAPAPPVVGNAIYRQIDGSGDWVLIGEDVPANGSLVDPIPTLNGTNAYKAIASTADTGAAESARVDVEVAEPGWIYLNWGPTFTSSCRFYGNPKLSGTTTREKTLHQFAGRSKPVAFFGESLSQKVAVSGRLTPDSSSLYEVEDAVRNAEITCFRDPKGRRIFGVLGDLSHQWETPTLSSISLDVQEVDFVE